MSTDSLKSVERVLIYRLGSLGDTVVALPCFHQIARAFPNAERRLLTNVPVHSKAPAAYTVLEGSGLIAENGYMRYPLGTRNVAELRTLRSQIRQWNPQVLVYLTVRRSWQQVARDVAFFRLCGIPKIIGAPFSEDARSNRIDTASGLYEPEAARLARNLGALGEIHLDDPANWNLHLTPAEHARAQQELLPLDGRPFLACSLGTKVQAKDWGIDNWRTVLRALAQQYPDLGMVLIGAQEERAASDLAAVAWQGRCVNLCGSLTPRESAAVLAQARLLLGHDSGPMHLAAAVQTRCVAVFAARNRPAIWFPYGEGHKILYHRTDCWGCGLEVCLVQRKQCLTAISPEAVLAAVQTMLSDVL